MEPTDRIDIDRFDDWLDQLARGIANPPPDGADALSEVAIWFQQKGQQTMGPIPFNRQLGTQLRLELAGGHDTPVVARRSCACTTVDDASGLTPRVLMAAAAALLIAVPAILLFVQNFNDGLDDPAIPAPTNGLAEPGIPVVCAVDQPVLLTISGSPQNEEVLQQNTFVSDPRHPADGAVAILEQDLPAGPAASDGDLVDIQRTLSTLAACIHVGDFVSADALYSDDSFRRVGSIRKVGGEAAPTSLALPAKIVLPIILRSNVLPDGRIGVLIEQDLWGFGLHEYFILVNSERGWLVDEVSLVAPTRSVASPIALTAIKIVATDLTFAPSFLAIPANTDVTLTISNEGSVPHSFAISEFDIEVRVEPGQSADITLNLQPGIYDFKSTVANQGGFMYGTLTVG